MIRNVAIAAERTFAPTVRCSGTNGSSITTNGSGLENDSSIVFKENYESLLKLVSRLNASHVGLSKESIMSVSPGSKSGLRLSPTATTIHVHENSNYSIGVFILGHNKKIPLHDHPNMFGMIKCIHGKLSIKSYTPLPSTGTTYTVPSRVLSRIPKEMFPTLTPCKLSEEKVVVSTEETVCSLDPANGNIHEITAIDGPAAFIDILSPPYDGHERDCTYYTLLDGGGRENDVTWLMPTQPPRDYWTQPAEYCGPPVI